MPDFLTQFGETLNLQTISSASFTLTNEQHGKTLLFSSATPQTLVIRKGLLIGSASRIIVTGAGGLTISPNSGVTVRNNFVITNQYSSVNLINYASNTYSLEMPVGANADTCVYLATYGHTQSGLDAAIAAIGSSAKVLRLTSQCSVTSDTTIPANIEVQFIGDGSFTIASGKTLAIGCMGQTPAKQVFFGSGSAVFNQNATGGNFRIEWWAGLANSGDSTAAFNQAASSVQANLGGVINFGPGTWKLDNCIIPSFATIKGAGGGADGSTGTVWRVNNLASNSVFQINGAYRYINIEDGIISTSTSNVSSGIVISGTAPNTGVGIYFKRVKFTGSSVSEQCYIQDLAGTWQSTQIKFEQCAWIVPTNGTGLRIDTPNSLVEVDQALFQAGVGATCIFGYHFGFLRVSNTEFAGTGLSALPYGTTLDRTITGSIAINTKNLTLNSGTLTANDLGRPVLITGKLDSYIDSITDATHCTVHDNATATASIDSLKIYKWSDPGTRAYCAVYVGGSHGNVELDNCVDEGFQYFLLNDASDQIGAFEIHNCWPQSWIQMNQSAVIQSSGNHYFSQIFRTGAAAQLKLSAIGDTIHPQCVQIMTGNVQPVLLTPSVRGEQSGIMFRGAEFSHKYTTYRQQMRMPTDIVFGQEWVSSPAVTEPVWGIKLPMDITGGPPYKSLFRYGEADTASENWTYYVDHYRDANGIFHVDCNQTPQKGFQYNCYIKSNIPIGGIGYATGAGGTVTQLTNKGTSVNLDTSCGAITTNNANLNANTSVTFTFNNSGIEASDVLVLNHISGGTVGSYVLNAQCQGANAKITITNITAGNLAEAIVIQFAVIKGVNA